MDEKSVLFTAEANAARLERTIVRLWILLILMLIMLVGTNTAWIYYENQFEDTVVTQEVETGEGDANVTGIGDIHNGENKTDGEEKNP